MWPLPSISNEHVTIHVSPHDITLSWFAQPVAKKPLLLKAYQRITLSGAELLDGVLFNPTRIAQHINQFIAKHRLQDAFVSCALESPRLVEKFIHCPVPNPAPHEIADHSHKNCNWHELYLYPTDNNQHFLHVCGIPRELLAQYQLLATRTNLNLTTITSQKMALFTLYRHLCNTAYSYGRLAADLERYNNAIEQSFSLETVRRTVSIAHAVHIDVEQEARYLLTAAGLLVKGDTL